MEKDSYSIDDIISEVKRHKEAENKTDESLDNGDEKDADGNVPDENDTDNEDVRREEAEEIFSITEEDRDQEVGAEENEEQVSDEAADEKVQSGDNADEAEKPAEDAEKVEKAEEKVNADELRSSNESVAVTDEVSEELPKEDVPDGYVDLLSIAAEEDVIPPVLQETEENDEEDEKKNKTKDKKKSSKKLKIFIAVIVILLLLIAAVGAYGYYYINNTLKNISESDDNTVSDEAEWTGMDELIENFPEIYETDASQLSSLQDMIRDWYYNGAPCSSSHVLNVLLIGEDTRGDEILDDETRADAAIIASVNIDTQTITLTSVLRDTYAYWEDTAGDEDTAEFSKINAAMSTSGIEGYINCIQNLYKIDIDSYVIVNFSSFESIIDEIGGVELELTTAEIEEINNHPSRYGDVYIEKTFEGDSGTLLLDGSQALAYCRIRKIDSDNARADRQKTCLYQIFKEVQDGSTVTQLKVVNTLLPYVKTGFSSSEILSIAKYALSQGWLSFDVEMLTVPYSRINESGAGGTYYGAWCWKADFPQDAYYLQTMIYGKSSIILAQERVDILNCNLYGFYEDTLMPCYATIYNYNYKEVTTFVSDDEDESTTTSN